MSSLALRIRCSAPVRDRTLQLRAILKFLRTHSAYANNPYNTRQQTGPLTAGKKGALAAALENILKYQLNSPAGAAAAGPSPAAQPAAAAGAGDFAYHHQQQQQQGYAQQQQDPAAAAAGMHQPWNRNLPPQQAAMQRGYTPNESVASRAHHPSELRSICFFVCSRCFCLCALQSLRSLRSIQPRL